MRIDGKHAMVMAVVAATLGSTMAGESNYDMERSTVRFGLHRSAGGGFSMDSTPGPASNQSGGAYELSTGPLSAFDPADCNADRRVNLLDAAAFQSCLTGPAGGAPAGLCACFDISADNGVDLDDFAVLQNEYDGTP